MTHLANEGCDCCCILVCQPIINYQLIQTRSKRLKRNRKEKTAKEMQPCIIVSAFGPDQMKPSTDVGETLGCGGDSGGQRRQRKGKKNSNINNEVKETVVAAAAAVGRRRKQRRS